MGLVQRQGMNATFEFCLARPFVLRYKYIFGGPWEHSSAGSFLFDLRIVLILRLNATPLKNGRNLAIFVKILLLGSNRAAASRGSRSCLCSCGGPPFARQRDMTITDSVS